MTMAYLQFRARMLSINPLTDLAEMIGMVQLDLYNRRNAHRRDHYQAMAQEANQ